MSLDHQAFLNLRKKLKDDRNQIHVLDKEKLEELAFAAKRSIEILKDQIKESLDGGNGCSLLSYKLEIRQMRKSAKIFEKELSRRAS